MNELENFYKHDEKKYILDEKSLFKIFEQFNYETYMTIDDLQSLIDKIALWYEIKYPEREFDYYDGLKGMSIPDMELSSVMDTEQLLYRLNDKQVALLKCKYRTSNDIEDIKNIGKEVMVNIKRKPKDNYYSKYKNFPVIVDADTGVVRMDYEIEKYVNLESVSLDELHYIFADKYSDRLDYTELDRCVIHHGMDKFVRDSMLEYVTLKLIYSKNTTPERGYVRAKRFASEFEKNLNVKVYMDKVDEIMNSYYFGMGKVMVKSKY